MTRALSFFPVVLLALASAAYFLLPSLYAGAFAALLTLAGAVSCIAFSLYTRGMPRLSELKISQWLLIIFAVLVVSSVAASRQPYHSFFGFGAGMTTGIFLLLVSLAGIAASRMPSMVRTALRFAASAIILLLLVYPLMRSDISVRPSFSTSVVVAAEAYKMEGMRLLLLGTGPGTFAYLWQQYRPQEVLQTPLWNEDFPTGSSAGVTLALEAGLLAALVLALFFVCVVAEQVARAFRTERVGGNKYIFFGFLGVLALAVALFASAEPSALLVGAGVLLAGALSGNDLPDKKPTKLFRVLVLAGAGLLTAWCIALLISLTYYFFAYADLHRGELESAKTSALRAHTLSPSGQSARLLAQIERARGHALGERGLVQNKGAVVSAFSSGVGYAKRATSLEAQNGESWKLLAILYAEELALSPSQEKFDQVDAALREAARRKRNDPSILMIQAQANFFAGKQTEAKALLTQALTLKPDYAEAEELLETLQKVSP